MEEEYVCEYCHKLYNIFDVNISTSRRSNIDKTSSGGVTTEGRFISAGFGSEFDTGGGYRDDSYRIISDDVPDMEHVCTYCVRNLISQKKIILQTVSQECFKCKSEFKEYKEFRKRMTLYNDDDKEWFYCNYASRFKKLKYRVDKCDRELIKSANENFIKQRATRDTRYCRNYYPLWICKPCFKYSERYNEIVNSLVILPKDLCGIISEYTPNFLTSTCKLCSIVVEDIDVMDRRYIKDTEIIILILKGLDLDSKILDIHFTHRIQFKDDNNKLKEDLKGQNICEHCAKKMIENNVLIIERISFNLTIGNDTIYVN